MPSATRQSLALDSRAVSSTGSTNLRTLLNLRKLEEISDDSVWSALSDNAVRRAIPARRVVFTEGDPAPNIFLIESGQVLVRRHRRQAPRPTVRVLSDGDLFTYDCGGTRAATCETVTDCVVLQIDGRKLQSAARTSPLLGRVLCAVHSAELEMILESLDQAARSMLALLPSRPRTAATGGAAPSAAPSATILRPQFGG